VLSQCFINQKDRIFADQDFLHGVFDAINSDPIFINFRMVKGTITEIFTVGII